MDASTRGAIAERWDATFAPLGRSAPAQRADESNGDYRRRLCRIGKKYIPAGEPIAAVPFDHRLPDNALDQFEAKMMEAVSRNITRVDNMAPGQLRAVHRTDPQTGYKEITYVGPQSFVLDPAYGHRPGRLVTRINAPVQEPLAIFRRPNPREGWVR
jgi:hypothetical protein